MELLQLSINYIEIATIFQSLDPYQQTEYLQLLQDYLFLHQNQIGLYLIPMLFHISIFFHL
jgi:hypothetical protein